jgi:alkylation response protein AidB-like acyl-CoA dehydrogenase
LTQRSPWMDDELELFREAARRFVEAEICPNDARWREQHLVDRELWTRAGEVGLLCTDIPAEYGGQGGDARHEAVLVEEVGRKGITSFGHVVHSIVAHYVLNHGTEPQKRSWLPRMASGELVGAIAMSEPAAGSDLQGIKTTALRQADGSFVVNGSKTFITNGWHADLVIVVAKTNPAAGAKGTSLLLLERGMPGFETGKRLKKLGLKAQDTSELFFDNVRVPAENLLGGPAFENRGFICLMEQLPWERMQIAVTAVESAQAAIDWTVQYVKDRKVFGQPVASYQNTRYTLAELQTEVQVARVFVDKCLELVLEAKLDTATASMAKYWTTDLQCKVMDECVQLHGGYGYMWEYPITRAYADARVQRIYGGTNEIMKEVISRGMGLGAR